jgi:hypothetical protein
MNVWAPNLEFVRSFSTGAALFELAVVPGGGFVGVANGTRPASFGFPLHAMNLTGDLTASFGFQGTIIGRPARADLSQKVAVDGQAVWTSPQSQYTLTEWTMENRILAILRIATPHFPDVDITRPPVSPLAERPDPALRDIIVSPEGMLWTLAQVASPDWRAAPPGVRLEVSNWDRYFKDVLQVIDPEAGRIMATRWLPAGFFGFGSSNTIHSVEETADGYITLKVWRMRLVQR